MLSAVMFFAGSAAAWYAEIPVSRIMSHYSYNVLVILVMMELFTNIAAQTGIMQKSAVCIFRIVEGRKRQCLIWFGAMMFAISAFLNNITAVMMILPVIFVFMKALDADKKFMCTFFAALLAVSNTGGASSPIGDFPAIIIMTSGITTFTGYLWRAMLLFGLTTAVLLAVWSINVPQRKMKALRAAWQS